MTATDALITLGLFIGVGGIAGLACWVIDRVAKKKQADWRGENGMRGSR